MIFQHLTPCDRPQIGDSYSVLALPDFKSETLCRSIFDILRCSLVATGDDLTVPENLVAAPRIFRHENARGELDPRVCQSVIRVITFYFFKAVSVLDSFFSLSCCMYLCMYGHLKKSSFLLIIIPCKKLQNSKSSVLVSIDFYYQIDFGDDSGRCSF